MRSLGALVTENIMWRGATLSFHDARAEMSGTTERRMLDVPVQVLFTIKQLG